MDFFAAIFNEPHNLANLLAPAVAVFPLIGGILLYLLREKHDRIRELLSVLIAFITLGGVLIMLPAVQERAITLNLEGFMQFGLYFRVDIIGWIFAFIISFIWFLATIFSITYMSFEHDLRRYYSILIFTLGATLGVVLSGDFFTLFLFFEMMTFSSYVLVIHEKEKEAMEAGTLYLYLGVAGGLALLMGMFLLFAEAGTLEMIPLLGAMGPNRILIFILFLIGFGIKAGVVPLHIWLPKAHPVAPSPASALLSGLMIKAGAYGIMRISLMVFTPEYPGVSGESFATGSGYFLLWLGIATMFLGALMALLQKNAKRILAYSSVSQMGYIIMGVGVAAFRGYDGGAMGFAGALYHLVNHAFFKAGLFMMIGSVFMYTRELNMDKLGGMLRRMPIVGVCFLVSAAGIAGIPGFNGYPSKTLLHDALLYAYKDLDLVSIDIAEKIFVLTSAMTICYFIKLFRGVFLGSVPSEHDKEYPLPLPAKISLGSFAVIITAIGIFPTFILDRFVLPAAHLLNFKEKTVDYMIGFNFWHWPLLEAMVIVVLLAAIIYLVGDRMKLFDIKPPHWLSIEYSVYRPVTSFLFNSLFRAGPVVDNTVNKIYDSSGVTGRNVCGYIGKVDSAVDNIYEKSGTGARFITDKATRMDEAINEAYEKSGRIGQGLVKGSQRIDKALDDAYEKTGSSAKRIVTNSTGNGKNGKELTPEEEAARESEEKPAAKTKLIDIRNLNFDSLLMAAVLGAILFILFYYGTR